MLTTRTQWQDLIFSIVGIGMVVDFADTNGKFKGTIRQKVIGCVYITKTYRFQILKQAFTYKDKIVTQQTYKFRTLQLNIFEKTKMFAKLFLQATFSLEQLNCKLLLVTRTFKEESVALFAVQSAQSQIRFSKIYSDHSG